MIFQVILPTSGELVELLGGIAEEIGGIGLWLQAFGILIILWVAFQLVNVYLNLKRFKVVGKIRTDVHRLEKKVDLLVKRKS